MTRIIFPDFRDENLQSRYPFADTASLTTTTGLTFEPDVFIDASLYPITADTDFYLQRIEISAGEVKLVIQGLAGQDLCSAAFDPLLPPELLNFTDVYGRPAGVMVTNTAKLNQLGSWGFGTHRFDAAATPLLVSTIIPTPEIGVRGIQLESGELFTGDVWLVGGDGVVLREDEGHIRVDVVGDPLFKRAVCGPLDTFVTPRFVRTLNGVTPDTYGGMLLTASRRLADDTILRITPTADGLKIEAVGRLAKEA